MAFSVTAITLDRNMCGRASTSRANDEPYQIRRLLTERAVRASDKRARFVGLAAYQVAGGNVLRDLFKRMAVAG